MKTYLLTLLYFATGSLVNAEDNNTNKNEDVHLGDRLTSVSFSIHVFSFHDCIRFRSQGISLDLKPKPAGPPRQFQTSARTC